MKSKDSRRIDFIFAAVFFCLFLLFVSLSITKNQSKKSTVVIFSDGALFGSYELNVDRKINVNEKMTVMIQNERVFVESTTCPGKDCKNHGDLTHVPIVCIPNNIVISFADSEFDGVVS